ncbi:uncharacterized protein BJ171DRAFT_532560 [Polychytrium aggregatum]|uniref:uncharacterized protein n=1 Tax=Polychytrium aggregatum TaxID=110093 RepID=UPI0022FEACA6|nr:uncharacterized protein BJ171DRAFT_532560 [Polychytrium aggregatum]KAI9193150.1 hypothetical protein BJ171DRAFT_532560 [Polychytrium aggregatum]
MNPYFHHSPQEPNSRLAGQNRLPPSSELLPDPKKHPLSQPFADPVASQPLPYPSMLASPGYHYSHYLPNGAQPELSYADMPPIGAPVQPHPYLMHEYPPVVGDLAAMTRHDPQSLPKPDAQLLPAFAPSQWKVAQTQNQSQTQNHTQNHTQPSVYQFSPQELPSPSHFDSSKRIQTLSQTRQLKPQSPSFPPSFPHPHSHSHSQLASISRSHPSPPSIPPSPLSQLQSPGAHQASAAHTQGPSQVPGHSHASGPFSDHSQIRTQIASNGHAHALDHGHVPHVPTHLHAQVPNHGHLSGHSQMPSHHHQHPSQLPAHPSARQNAQDPSFGLPHVQDYYSSIPAHTLIDHMSTPARFNPEFGAMPFPNSVRIDQAAILDGIPKSDMTLSPHRDPAQTLAEDGFHPVPAQRYLPAEYPEYGSLPVSSSLPQHERRDVHPHHPHPHPLPLPHPLPHSADVKPKKTALSQVATKTIDKSGKNKPAAVVQSLLRHRSSPTGSSQLLGDASQPSSPPSESDPGRKVIQELGHCRSCHASLVHLTLYGPSSLFQEPYEVNLVCEPCRSSTAAGEPPASLEESLASPESLAVTCDVCKGCICWGGVGIQKPEGWKKAAFDVDTLCKTCEQKYQFCTECGGGGRRRTGKWRPKELFSENKKTCNLQHIRIGKDVAVKYVVFNISSPTSSALNSAFLSQVLQMIRDINMEKIAIPQKMETHVSFSTFERIVQRLDGVTDEARDDIMRPCAMGELKFLIMGQVPIPKTRRRRQQGSLVDLGRASDPHMYISVAIVKLDLGSRCLRFSYGADRQYKIGGSPHSVSLMRAMVEYLQSEPLSPELHRFYSRDPLASTAYPAPTLGSLVRYIFMRARKPNKSTNFTDNTLRRLSFLPQSEFVHRVAVEENQQIDESIFVENIKMPPEVLVDFEIYVAKVDEFMKVSCPSKQGHMA